MFLLWPRLFIDSTMLYKHNTLLNAHADYFQMLLIAILLQAALLVIQWIQYKFSNNSANYRFCGAETLSSNCCYYVVIDPLYKEIFNGLCRFREVLVRVLNWVAGR